MAGAVATTLTVANRLRWRTLHEKGKLDWGESGGFMRSESMSKIVIEVGKQMDGATFRLSPKTRVFLSSRIKNLRPPTSVFVSNETASDFAHYYGPLREHLVMILTGVPESDLQRVGGVEFVTPEDGKVLFGSSPAR